jgi:hypothetical protein
MHAHSLYYKRYCMFADRVTMLQGKFFEPSITRSGPSICKFLHRQSLKRHICRSCANDFYSSVLWCLLSTFPPHGLYMGYIYSARLHYEVADDVPVPL